MTQDEAKLQRATARLLALLGAHLEHMTPEDVDLRTVRSISSTLKDIRDLQAVQREAQELTVTLEEEVENYAR